MPWTWPSRARDRAEIERLSGQRAVPILVVDDDTVISGSGTIAAWARDTPPARRLAGCRCWAHVNCGWVGNG